MGRNRTLGSPFRAQTVTSSFATLGDVDMYCVDAPGGGVTATLDPNAADGDQVVIQDVADSASTESITVVPGPGQTILNGFGDSYSIDTNGGGALFTYSLGLGGWNPQAIFTLPNPLGPNVTTSGTPPSIAVQPDAGTDATASLSSNANDTAGLITLNTGAAGTTAGPQAIVTFATPFARAPRSVVLFSANDNACDFVYYWFVDTVTTTSFTVEVMGALSGPLTYQLWYVVLG